MNKQDISDMHLNRPYKTQIVLSKYVLPEDESHDLGWECDILHDGEYIGGGTSPTQEGAYDLANEILYDYENQSLW